MAVAFALLLSSFSAHARFTQADRWQGQNRQPITLNKYVYANANPVNYTDPTGHYASLSEANAVNTISNILRETQMNVGFSILDAHDRGKNGSGNEYIKDEVRGILIGAAIGLLLPPILSSAGKAVADRLGSTSKLYRLAKTGAIVADELAELLEVWDKASFSTLEDSIVYHADKHFSGDIIGMLRKASNFNTRGARKIRHSDGSIRYQKGNGEYIMKRDGKIISYGYN
ncbi:MAG: hypothetical protein DRH26_15695 [Deltaproteobacteria bacterium]|nr:MAG: hypothetical protein DRH26_15695 [Deltaproteobacteria bacterium]